MFVIIGSHWKYSNEVKFWNCIYKKKKKKTNYIAQMLVFTALFLIIFSILWTKFYFEEFYFYPQLK